MKDWNSLTVDNFEDYLLMDTGPQVGLLTTTPTIPASVPATSAPTASAPVDVMAITNSVSAAVLVKPPVSWTDIFMKNRGGREDVKPLKEQKQCNTLQWTFLSVVHAYDFKDVTNISYTPDPMDANACTVFDLQKKHAFSILVSSIKESSALPVI